MKIKKAIVILLCIAMTVSCSGCELSDLLKSDISETITTEDENITLTYEAMMYDNTGNNYATFKGNSFNITPNKVKQYGYSTNGSWDWWYETSSVVTIEIDGNYVQSCGSTVIFKDSRLEITPLETEIKAADSSGDSEYTVDVPDENLDTYFSLKNWWYNSTEKGQGGEKVVLIQSQDGYNIGIVEGDDVTWKVAGKLPKTTLITVDGMPLYLHRCNFTIIDTELIAE